MRNTTQLRFTEPKRRQRQSIELPVLAERCRKGDIRLRMTSISAEGFMAVGVTGLPIGERLMLRLPVVGCIEAHLEWHSGVRSGFRFERLIRGNDFDELLTRLEIRQRERAND